MRRTLVIALTLFVPSLLCGACVWGFWPYHSLGTFDLGEGYTLQVWTDDDLFNIDWLGPLIKCRITDGSGRIVLDSVGDYGGQQLRYRAAFADGGKLACVYEENATPDVMNLWIIDLPSGECWPKHSDPPIRARRWAERFGRIRHENPTVPEFRCFEDEAKP